MNDAQTIEVGEYLLGSLAKGHRGVSYKPEQLRRSADHTTATLLRATNIQNGSLDFSDVQFVPKSIVSPTQILEEGDVAVCMSNGSKALVGKSARFGSGQTGTFTVGAFCSIFKPADKEFRDLIIHLFSSQAYQRAIDVALSGSAINNLKNSDIEAVRLLLPPRTTWQRITTILASLDSAIEATELLIKKHQQIKAGLMHDLFTHGLQLDGALRPPPAVDADCYQRTVLGLLPHGWHVSSLRTCLSEGASNGIYKPPHLIGSGTLLIGQTALTEDRSVEPRLARRATVSQQDLRRFGLAAGDILIARVFATVEGVGRPALVPELGEPAVFESNMMRLRVNTSIIRPRLLFEWLKGDVSRRHIEGRANASNQVSVNQGVFYPMPVPIPPPDEQDRMLARIEAADMRRSADLEVLAKLRSMKRGLMQDLLTGKVPVELPDPTREPAIA